jgi:hypothetical protein
MRKEQKYSKEILKTLDLPENFYYPFEMENQELANTI